MSLVMAISGLAEIARECLLSGYNGQPVTLSTQSGPSEADSVQRFGVQESPNTGLAGLSVRAPM
jgi:hypothetical protein